MCAAGGVSDCCLVSVCTYVTVCLVGAHYCVYVTQCVFFGWCVNTDLQYIWCVYDGTIYVCLGVHTVFSFSGVSVHIVLVFGVYTTRVSLMSVDYSQFGVYTMSLCGQRLWFVYIQVFLAVT